MTLQQRWEHVEQPILEALAGGDGSSMSSSQLVEATGIETPVLMRALRSLKEADYISAVLLTADEADYPLAADSVRLLERGLRQTRLWPNEDWSAALVAELEKAIQDEADEHERTKLDGVLGAVKTAAGMTLNAVIANAVGIGRVHLGL
jgi:hypothetical protein